MWLVFALKLFPICHINAFMLLYWGVPLFILALSPGEKKSSCVRNEKTKK